ncbi:MAG: DUF997 domain-containing protein [Planctomycetota bacterium]|jgi:small neutral amino acid transporter SnatA (MarC family)
MKKKRSARTRLIFIVAFLALTFLCWCPLLYGPYGPADRILGVPLWTVLAALFGVILFVLEWIYLFVTGMAMTDEELPEIVSELAEVNTGESDSPKEAE